MCPNKLPSTEGTPRSNLQASRCLSRGLRARKTATPADHGAYLTRGRAGLVPSIPYLLEKA